MSTPCLILSSYSSVLRTAGPAGDLQAAINAAIRQDGLPSYVGGSFRREPEDNVCNFFRMAQALNRRFTGPGVANLLRRGTGGPRPGPCQLSQTGSARR